MEFFQEVLHRDAVYTASLNEHLKFLLSEIPRSFAKGDGFVRHNILGGITPPVLLSKTGGVRYHGLKPSGVFHRIMA